MVVQLPYKWGCVDSINRIRRGTGKLVKVVSTRGNQKAKSVGMGRDFPFFLIANIVYFAEKVNNENIVIRK